MSETTRLIKNEEYFPLRIKLLHLPTVLLNASTKLCLSDCDEKILFSPFFLGDATARLPGCVSYSFHGSRQRVPRERPAGGRWCLCTGLA
jgi:hypothetical protein